MEHKFVVLHTGNSSLMLAMEPNRDSRRRDTVLCAASCERAQLICSCRLFSCTSSKALGMHQLLLHQCKCNQLVKANIPNNNSGQNSTQKSLLEIPGQSLHH